MKNLLHASNKSIGDLELWTLCSNLGCFRGNTDRSRILILGDEELTLQIDVGEHNSIVYAIKVMQKHKSAFSCFICCLVSPYSNLGWVPHKFHYTPYFMNIVHCYHYLCQDAWLGLGFPPQITVTCGLFLCVHLRALRMQNSSAVNTEYFCWKYCCIPFAFATEIPGCSPSSETISDKWKPYSSQLKVFYPPLPAGLTLGTF